ncbi:hypothetical protein CK203_061765 [Vitis vinifera]|uniref:DUF4283 domain-containing protein n=1 Tax=Vitis vinifera TaxID=29760 RepID=A0A438GSM4_VITVI|nr:hypothetical protein CK203_061765 [Vitis vinifera]
MGQTISEIGRLRVAEFTASGSRVHLLFNTAMVGGETRVDGSDFRRPKTRWATSERLGMKEKETHALVFKMAKQGSCVLCSDVGKSSRWCRVLRWPANSVGEENYLRAWEKLFAGPANGGGLGPKARGKGQVTEGQNDFNGNGRPKTSPYKDPEAELARSREARAPDKEMGGSGELEGEMIGSQMGSRSPAVNITELTNEALREEASRYSDLFYRPLSVLGKREKSLSSTPSVRRGESAAMAGVINHSSSSDEVGGEVMGPLRMIWADGREAEVLELRGWKPGSSERNQRGLRIGPFMRIWREGRRGGTLLAIPVVWLSLAAILECQRRDLKGKFCYYLKECKKGRFRKDKGIWPNIEERKGEFLGGVGAIRGSGMGHGPFYLERRVNNQTFSRLDRGWRRGPSPFRFEKHVLKVEGVKELMKSWWEGYSSGMQGKKISRLNLEELEARKEAREDYKKMGFT